jgi:glutamate/tyrosine decarboxylase-like PLP-dependent enzyme
LGEAIQANIDQAKYLGKLVEARPELELLAPVSLNAVCFRYLAPGSSPSDLNDLNLEILAQLQVRGIAVPSQTILSDRFAIRVCITNHRSEMHDFDTLVEAVIAIGAELTNGALAH